MQVPHRREEHRRRRRHPPADAPPLPRRGVRPAAASSCPPPGEYGVGMVFLPHDPGEPRRLRAAVREGRPRRGPDVPRLARRADRQQHARPDRASGRAGHQAGLHRPRRRHVADDDWPSSASSTSSASASRTRCAGSDVPEQGDVLRPQPVVHDAHLQGHAQLRPAAAVLPGPARPGVESALALVHSRFSTNTFPSWAARASLPLHRATTARSTRCAATSTGCTRARACSSRELFGDDMAEVHAGHRRPTAATRPCSTTRWSCWCCGPLAAARGDDDDPRAVGEPRVDEPGEARPSTSTTPA